VRALFAALMRRKRPVDVAVTTSGRSCSLEMVSSRVRRVIATLVGIVEVVRIVLTATQQLSQLLSGSGHRRFRRFWRTGRRQL